MIQLNRNYHPPDKTDEEIPIKVIGVGGAGTNVLDRIVLDGLSKADLIAFNTDVQSLASSVAAHKVQLGRTITRGLGAGGDPELGYDAACESADEIRQALTGARMIFVCAGLGGGTGSGAAPAVAQAARESGSLVVIFATLPFSFEGKRRMTQAREALDRMREYADAVICFENDRMGDMVAPKAGIHQAFGATDVTISQCVRSIINLIQRPGLIRIGFDDLLSALRGPGGRCLFGYGESDSDNRAHDSLKLALKSPLIDRGRSLADATHVLVHVAGGPAMTLSEVEILMQELGRHIHDHTQILFGTSVDGRMGNRLSVTLISSLPAEEEVNRPTTRAKPESVKKSEPIMDAAPMPKVEPVKVERAKVEPMKVEPVKVEPVKVEPVKVEPVKVERAKVEPVEVERAKVEPVEIKRVRVEPVRADQVLKSEWAKVVEPVEENDPMPSIDESEEAAKEMGSEQHGVDQEEEKKERVLDFMAQAVPPPSHPEEPVTDHAPRPRLILPKKKPLQAKEQKPVEEKKVHAKQEVLQFEPVTRGRFEKSEPTIVEGQDLDIPTFLRKNVRVK